jgi:hypothetical protein
VTLNTGYLIFGIYFMHRRLLSKEKWRWYRQDVATPLIAAMATAALCRWAIPAAINKIAEFALLMIISACVLIAAALMAPMLRHQIARHLPGRGRLVTTGRRKQP